MKRLPLHPFALAIYPILQLAAENVDWGVRWTDLLLPVLLSLGLAGLGWLVAGRLSRNVSRRGVWTLIWVLFWLWYGTFLQGFTWLADKTLTELHTIAFSTWVLAIGLAAVAIHRFRELSHPSAMFLNLFSAFLLLFPVYTLARGGATRWESNRPVGHENLTSDEASPRATGPDIYFIVLDEYSSTRSLRANWDFDNRGFEDSLRQRGFFVPSRARSNYVHTHLSLASMLNWTHLLDLEEKAGDGSDRSWAYHMIEDNRAAGYLQSQGYEFVFFPTTFRATSRNRLANRQIPAPKPASANFLFVWLAQTPLTPAIVWFCYATSCAQDGRFPYTPETAEETRWKLRRLVELADEPGPRFVFVHLLLPHPPYIFHADCSNRKPAWPVAGDPSAWPNVKKGYVDQIQCLNALLLALIDQILERSERDPVIVLQADHGHGRMQLDPMMNRWIPLAQLSADRVAERTGVFAAYHLPEGGTEMLYDSITPVNVLPIILNHYFGKEIPLSPDATYWSEPRTSYRFKRIEAERASARPGR